MKTEIINIGDELLIGQVINTNAAWMAEKLNLSGFPVAQVTVVADDPDAIRDALARASGQNDITIITGGLGPTKDDITKKVLCDFFTTRLVFSEAVYRNIENMFRGRGFQVTPSNRAQAEVPENCTLLPNRNGTAPGMWFDVPGKPGSIMISLPGVPFEMKGIMEEEVIPRLKNKYHTIAIVHKTILTQGVGESFLADLIEPWEDVLPGNISLAYLPQPGIVRLRLTGTGGDEDSVRAAVEAEAAKLEELIPQHIFGYDDDTLEHIIGMMLKDRKATLGTAESCTGGYIAHLITSVPGSSAYFLGSVVAYDNAVKENVLGVPKEDIEAHGAVSGEVVTRMAEGARHALGCDYAIAVSGIAGPEGSTAEKPVGTTWIAIATPRGTEATRFLFGDHRERNIRRASLQALNLLRKELLDK